MSSATITPEFEEVPVIVAPKAAVKADAKNRALRTLLQGFLIDLLIAGAVTAHTILTSQTFTWSILGLAVLKTLLTTLTSYVMRVKMGGALLFDKNQDSEPIRVNVGGYELELQRPGKADHAAGV